MSAMKLFKKCMITLGSNDSVNKVTYEKNIPVIKAKTNCSKFPWTNPNKKADEKIAKVFP